MHNRRAVCVWEGNGITEFDLTVLGIRNTDTGKCLTDTLVVHKQVLRRVACLPFCGSVGIITLPDEKTR